jgi:lysozyme family protein
MDHVDELIARVIVREGGAAYTNDPDDAGGPTKYGVTQTALGDWRGRPVSAEDVRALTEAEAVQIYRKRYFPPGFEVIRDTAVLELLFDYGVNSGPRAAVMALQTVLKRIGKYDGVIDGAFGPKSSAALAAVRNVEALFYALKCERYEAYMRYIGRLPSQAKYATGWSNRNDHFEMKFAEAALGDSPVSVA